MTMLTRKCLLSDRLDPILRRCGPQHPRQSPEPTRGSPTCSYPQQWAATTSCGQALAPRAERPTVTALNSPVRLVPSGRKLLYTPSTCALALCSGLPAPCMAMLTLCPRPRAPRRRRPPPLQPQQDLLGDLCRWRGRRGQGGPPPSAAPRRPPGETGLLWPQTRTSPANQFQSKRAPWRATSKREA